MAVGTQEQLLPTAAVAGEELGRSEPTAPPEPARTPQPVQQQEVDDEPGYSLRTETRLFVSQGLPLCLAAFLEWGAPPVVTMFFAGATEDSEALQSALGYGRVFFNCTVLISLIGIGSYCWAVVPGCIGAGRRDRIPHYFRRSVLLSTLFMLPLFALQFAAGPIMRLLSVPAAIAADVGLYCRLMIGGGWLLLVEMHMEVVFVSCGFTRAASFNSLVTGIGIEVIASYLLVYRWRLGVLGAALNWTVVRASRIVVWLAIGAYFGTLREMFVPVGRERIFSGAELREFVVLATPQMASNFAGWLIFELQIIALTNVKGITHAQMAAGAIWVQCEQALAAAQTGWIQISRMRTVKLLGKRDPGAGKAFGVILALSTLVVAMYNAALLLNSNALSHLASNNVGVQREFERILWVLVPHGQTRLLALASCAMFIPLNKSSLSVGASYFCFYVIACPIVGVVALTDLITQSVAVKIAVCVGATTIAQTPLTLFGLGYCFLLDWDKAGKIINGRANTDLAGIAPVSAEQAVIRSGAP